MAGKVTPWRRKPKIRELAGELNTGCSFAVVASPEKFLKKLHAYKVLDILSAAGAEVYPVAPDLEKINKIKVYSNLESLPKRVDAVIPCLPEEFSLSIVQQAKENGINKVWFQKKTLSQEATEFCLNNKMEIIEGCVLMYKEFNNLLRFVNPCFWHSKTFTRQQK